MAPALVRDEAGVSTFWSLVGVVLLVAVILGVYYGYAVPRFGTSPVRASPGDEVQLRYIGRFEDTGLVFDTNIESIARDNATYPKAASFNAYGPWNVYEFKLGDPTDDQRPVPGFEQGIYNMAVGETRTIVVTPETGYGPANPALVQVKPIVESVVVRKVMNVAEFINYYGFDPVSGTNITDPFWGWNVFVQIASNIITTTNSPVPGEIVRPYDLWDAEVVGIDDAANDGEGVIEVRHRLDASMAHVVGQRDAEGQVTFVVTDVDLEAGTYILDFNREVVGRNLVFTVTMVDIIRLF